MLTFKQLRPLLDIEGNETCAFVIQTPSGFELWPTPSLRPAPDSYSIGRLAWENARKRTASEGKRLCGSLHTHPNGPLGPSTKDLQIAHYLRNGEIRMVWHPRSGTLTTYSREGLIAQQIIRAPLWIRPILWIFFY